MSFLLKYFWSIGIIVAFINSFLLNKNMKYKKPLIVYFVFMATPALFLQICQLLANYHTPLYILYRDYKNPFYWLGIASILVTLIIMLIIVIRIDSGLLELYSKIFFKASKLDKRQIIYTILTIIFFICIMLFLVSSKFNLSLLEKTYGN